MNTNQQRQSPGPQSRRLHLPLCWLVLMTFDAGLMALTMAQESDEQRTVSPGQAVETTISGPADIASDAIWREAIDLFLESGSEGLAAWQVELKSESTDAAIVEIEGGEHPAFAEAPYFDPRAINNQRVILGAFSTGDNLPRGRSRVARVHVQLRGPGERVWQTRLTTAANTEGTLIPAEIRIEKAQQ